MPESPAVSIEIVSDVICPWCFIGKRRLEKALASLRGELRAQVTWLPFQLNPGMPRQGMARADYRRAKFGSLERGAQLDAQVASHGSAEGIAFAFERIERTPNTIAAHQLIDLAQQQGRGDALVEALFRAYFESGRDVGDPGVLRELARDCGLAPDAAEARWADADDTRRIARLDEEVRGLGVAAVPTFVFERRFGVSGAQPPDTLAGAIREAAAQPAAG